MQNLIELYLTIHLCTFFVMIGAIIEHDKSSELQEKANWLLYLVVTLLSPLIFFISVGRCIQVFLINKENQ